MKKEEKDFEKIKSLLIKLKTMAERGEPNEKDVAHAKLIELLEKYQIDIAEIETQNSLKRDIKYNKEKVSGDILAGVIWSIKSNAQITENRHKKILTVHLNYSEYIEVLEKYKYYWDFFIKQREIFIYAFIVNNRLFTNDKSMIDNSAINNEPVDEIHRMMHSMKKGSFVPTKKMIET